MEGRACSRQSLRQKESIIFEHEKENKKCFSHFAIGNKRKQCLMAECVLWPALPWPSRAPLLLSEEKDTFEFERQKIHS